MRRRGLNVMPAVSRRTFIADETWRAYEEVLAFAVSDEERRTFGLCRQAYRFHFASCGVVTVSVDSLAVADHPKEGTGRVGANVEDVMLRLLGISSSV